MSKSRQLGFFFTGILCAAAVIGGFWVRQIAEAAPAANNPRQLLAAKSGYGELDEINYFNQLAALLRDNYVDPIEIDQKMASGAVRGMVGSLLDPNSQFYDPKQLQTYLNTQRGHYQGIGIELSYRFNETELAKLRDNENGVDGLLLLPEIYVASVMPGSPAQKAGIRPGDEIRQVGDRYVITGADVKTLRDLQTAVTEKKATTEQLTDFRNLMQTWVTNNIPAAKVRDELMTGTSGNVTLKVRRGGNEVKSFELAKTEVRVPVLTDGAAPGFRLFTGASKVLTRRDAVPSLLDLRNSGTGDFAEIESALAMILPTGKYGVIRLPSGESRSIEVKKGIEEPRMVTILVDQSTHGAAALFAHILSHSGIVNVEGDLPSAGQWIDLFRLPDGAGYTLSAGSYSPDGLETAFKSGGSKDQ